MNTFEYFGYCILLYFYSQKSLSAGFLLVIKYFHKKL